MLTGLVSRDEHESQAGLPEHLASPQRVALLLSKMSTAHRAPPSSFQRSFPLPYALLILLFQVTETAEVETTSSSTSSTHLPMSMPTASAWSQRPVLPFEHRVWHQYPPSMGLSLCPQARGHTHTRAALLPIINKHLPRPQIPSRCAPFPARTFTF